MKTNGVPSSSSSNGSSNKLHPNGSVGIRSTSTNSITNDYSLGKNDIGGCTWIPWESAFVRHMPDPTRLFSGLCLSIMFGRFLQTNEWNVKQAVFGLLLNPYVLFYLTTAVVTARWGVRAGATKASAKKEKDANLQMQQQQLQLPVYDRWTAEWYWWNSWLFHAVMDGSSGSLRLVPVVVQQYDMLDRRFISGHSVPWCIGMLELILMYPLCLFTCYCVLARSPLRFPLELVTSAIQLTGMLLFVGAEVYEGQVNIPALDPVGSLDDNGNSVIRLTFLSLYHVTYYWFGFWFCNLIWGVVPYYRIHRAVAECQRAFLVAAADHTAAAAAAARSSNNVKQE